MQRSVWPAGVQFINSTERGLQIVQYTAMCTIMLRVVPFDHRTLALGVNWTFLRLLGFIPGGILFGMLIDIACLDWETSCGNRQSCRVYDPLKLSWTITAL
ncbi:hypothetical protein TELCIR_23635, partial [Teladorsagia circumcincta]